MYDHIIFGFSVNEPGRDPGYGQSILHDGQLIFRTPPYIVNEISLQDAMGTIRRQVNVIKSGAESPKMVVVEKEKKEETKHVTKSSSPQNSLEKKVNRRYSSTSIR